MVLAEDSAAAGEGVVQELPGLLIVTQRPQDQAEEAGRGEGVGVVLAQDSAAAGEGVVLELPGLLIVTQRPQDQAELAGRGEGVGVVVAEDSAPPAQRLFLQFPGLPVVTQPEQVVGELAGGGEGVGVVLAEDSAAPGQGVFVERAGPLVLTQPPQVQRQVAGRGEGVGVIVTELVAPHVVGAFVRRQGGLGLATGQQVRRGAIEESGGLGRNRVQGVVAAGCGQDMREQPSPEWPPARIGAHIAGCGLVEQPDHRRRPPGGRRDIRSLAAGAQQRGRDPVQLDAVRGHRGHPRRCRIAVQRASTSGSVAIGRNRSERASGWSVSRLSGTGSGPHHATTVSRSSAVGSSSASRSNATAHDAATDCG